MKILLAILIFGMLFSYPIPVGCNNGAHFPTFATANISQPFQHLGHVGIDYSIMVGTPVYAVMDGIVIWSGLYGNVYGRSVVLLHCDGYMSLYAHLSTTEVKFGQVVNSGELIARSGGDPNDKIDGDGWSSGAHLHLEIRVPGHLENNLYNIDPLIYLDEYLPEYTVRREAK